MIPEAIAANVIGATQQIRQAAALLNTATDKVLFVLDDAGRPIGSVTDGDLRRGILRGVAADAPVSEILHPNPRTIRSDATLQEILSAMHRERIAFMAMVDESGRMVRIESLQRLLDTPELDNPVVLMAGGLGERLRPLTEDTPKPMLNVGGRPLLETLLRSCCQHGFRNFHISVNHQAQKIIDYFGDGSRFGARVRYIRETARLGTAGSLRHIEPKPTAPILVVNGDIMTNVDFRNVLAFHRHHGAAATMVVREHQFQVPYGVVETANVTIEAIHEKPVLRHLINAGIYVLEPTALVHIPADRMYDMTSLFTDLRKSRERTLAFPLQEYWLDIGHLDDLERANMQYSMVFGSIE